MIHIYILIPVNDAWEYIGAEPDVASAKRSVLYQILVNKVRVELLIELHHNDDIIATGFFNGEELSWR